MMSEKGERMRASYRSQMQAADHKRAMRKTYSQEAMLAAHLDRISEICRECPMTEAQILQKLDRLIAERAAQISKKLEEQGGKNGKK